MDQKIQVKGTLPLVASYLGIEERKVYDIFNLNVKKETVVGSAEQTKGGSDGVTNKSKAIRTSKNSV